MMANEFATTRAKTITQNLINKIMENLETDDISNGLTPSQKLSYVSSVKIKAIDWWDEHGDELIGLSIAEVSTIFRNAKNKKELTKIYDKLVTSMTWKERLEFLRGGVRELQVSNSKKIRTAQLIGQIIELSPKILAIILMVL
ncbi:MAG: hypothetical protein ACXACY_07320 [Candidatus Hodarchaeales archaeon]|jgi:hypothetical protein